MIWWVVGCTGDLGVTKYNNGPEATILSHADGDQVAAGATASLRGQVTDADDATADLLASWLADGVEVCAPAAPAEDGTNLCDVPIAASDVAVTLEVRDPSNAIGTAEVVLVVGAAGLGSPVVEILDPADGTSVEAGTPVLFQGVVSDDADAASDLEVVWTSSLDGALDRPVPSISGVVSFTAPALSVGVHDVSLEATDALGLVGLATVRVEVVDCAVSWWADVDGDGYGDGIVQETIAGGQYGYAFFQGTSMASPHVAAAAALLLANGLRTPDEVREALTATATNMGKPYGALDVLAALDYAPTGGRVGRGGKGADRSGAARGEGGRPGEGRPEGREGAGDRAGVEERAGGEARPGAGERGGAGERPGGTVERPEGGAGGGGGARPGGGERPAGRSPAR